MGQTKKKTEPRREPAPQRIVTVVSVHLYILNTIILFPQFLCMVERAINSDFSDAPGYTIRKDLYVEVRTIDAFRTKPSKYI